MARPDMTGNPQPAPDTDCPAGAPCERPYPPRFPGPAPASHFDPHRFRPFPRHTHWRPPPPWRDRATADRWEESVHAQDVRQWWKARRRNQGRVFFRFAGIFGFLTLVLFGWMAALGFVLARTLQGGKPGLALMGVGGLALLVALPVFGGVLARRAFRNIATPLGDLMAASDAVASGDLSVRIPEEGPGDFAQIAASFNRMVEELERVDQRRRNLTADVAHELRTPLHIIRGNLEGILDGVYEPDDAHIQATLEETQLLARLIDDLRTLSLAETGQLTLHLEPVDLRELLQDARTSFGGQAEAAGITLDVAVAGAPEALTLQADPERLDQILGNLISNALRYTPEGGRIALAARPDDGGVRLTVADTGAGIPPEDLPFIFDRFWKGDRSRARSAGSGSGLGLAIVKHLVQLHGGVIEVASEREAGTTFTIFLPAA